MPHSERSSRESNGRIASNAFSFSGVGPVATPSSQATSTWSLYPRTLMGSGGSRGSQRSRSYRRGPWHWKPSAIHRRSSNGGRERSQSSGSPGTKACELPDSLSRSDGRRFESGRAHSAPHPSGATSGFPPSVDIRSTRIESVPRRRAILTLAVGLTASVAAFWLMGAMAPCSPYCVPPAGPYFSLTSAAYFGGASLATIGILLLGRGSRPPHDAVTLTIVTAATFMGLVFLFVYGAISGV